MDTLRSRLEQALAGTYTFERELGGGGMSRTYLVRETALNRQVVVKILAPELLAGLSVDRFRREVLLAAQLQHPHVVPVLTSGEIDGIPWFTMPYVDGDSLRQRLDAGAVGIGEAIGVLRDTARALAYAHARGIVHRDIKPDNVLLSGGSATVTDFGIAKAISAARTDTAGGSATLTQVGTAIGTPAYMAPEQAAGDPATDHRADLYAFGVMAYEVLAGRAPFVESSPTKLLAAHMTQVPRHIAELRADCPAPLAELVMQCLAKDPADRPQHAGALVAVLDTATTSGSGGPVPEILRGGPIKVGRALAMWAAATIAVVVTAWAAREVIGLPDWVLPGAIGVMLAGLPVLAFTTYVQRLAQRAYTATPTRSGASHGTLATLALKASPHVSWRRTWLGGAAAVGGFAALVVGFMVMRALGIGPMASLQGQGAFGSNETLVVADFRSPPSDSTLGGIVAEALRTDLAQSKALQVLSRGTMREILGRMGQSTESQVPFEVAREIATREGAKGVLDGEISRLGQQYLITASLRSALSGEELASFRETAASDDELLPTLGKLSRKVRERTGESFRTIRAGIALERVTTPSLQALRLYVEGQRLADEVGDADRGVELLREAVAIDTAFAMAWRKLATVLRRTSLSGNVEALAALETAYRHRDRLTEFERLMTEGSYFTDGPRPDLPKARAAYEQATQLDSVGGGALNNLAVLHQMLGDTERAEELLRRVVTQPRPFDGSFNALLQSQLQNRRSAATLDSTLAMYRAALPENGNLWEAEWLVAWSRGDMRTADSIASAITATGRTLRQQVISAFRKTNTQEVQGRYASARASARKASDAFWGRQSEPLRILGYAIDTAYYQLHQDADPQGAMTTVRRALQRASVDSIPPSERLWEPFLIYAAEAGDAQTARTLHALAVRDLIPVARDQRGRAAAFAAELARAEGRWADAIAQYQEALRLSSVGRHHAVGAIALSYDRLGQSDSALAYLTRFVDEPDLDAYDHAKYLPRFLVRAGELHEAAGRRAEAIASYRRFVELWRNADPEFQPKVREVQERITRLEQERG